MSGLSENIVSLVQEVCENSEPDLSDLDHPLLECGLDSLDYVSVLMAIEDKFEFDERGLSFVEGDMEALQSVNDIVRKLTELGVK